ETRTEHWRCSVPLLSSMLPPRISSLSLAISSSHHEGAVIQGLVVVDELHEFLSDLPLPRRALQPVAAGPGEYALAAAPELGDHQLGAHAALRRAFLDANVADETGSPRRRLLSPE